MTNTSTMLEDMINLVSIDFKKEIKAIALSDPYYTELMMDGLNKAKFIPGSFLFIGRGVRWHGIPIIYSNDPGIQIITTESDVVTKKIASHLASRGEGLDAVIEDIEKRTGPAKAETGLLDLGGMYS